MGLLLAMGLIGGYGVYNDPILFNEVYHNQVYSHIAGEKNSGWLKKESFYIVGEYKGEPNSAFYIGFEGLPQAQKSDDLRAKFYEIERKYLGKLPDTYFEPFGAKKYWLGMYEEYYELASGFSSIEEAKKAADYKFSLKSSMY